MIFYFLKIKKASFFIFFTILFIFFLFVHKQEVLAYFSDLGCEIRTDLNPKSGPKPNKPYYVHDPAHPNYSYIDPNFGSRILRVVGDSGTPIRTQTGEVIGTWPRVCRHHYSKDPAWNSDGTILYLNKGCNLFLDGKTYWPIKLSKPPGSESRWHPYDPNTMIYINGIEVGKWNPRTGQRLVIDLFEGYSRLSFGNYEGNLSRDGSMVFLYDINQKRGFAYNLETKFKYPDLYFTNRNVDWFSISYSGKYIIYDGDGDQTIVYDLYGNQVGPTWSERGCPSHYDLTVNQNGEDVAFGTCKTNNPQALITRHLSDGQKKDLSQGRSNSSSHSSTRNLSRPFLAMRLIPGMIHTKKKLLLLS